MLRRLVEAAFRLVAEILALPGHRVLIVMAVIASIQVITVLRVVTRIGVPVLCLAAAEFNISLVFLLIVGGTIFLNHAIPSPAPHLALAVLVMPVEQSPLVGAAVQLVPITIYGLTKRQTTASPAWLMAGIFQIPQI